jgi:hypothetical protein
MTKKIICFSIFFLNVCASAIQPQDAKIPIDNLYDRKEFYPIEMKSNVWKNFQTNYKNLTGDNPILSYKNKELAVSLVPARHKNIVERKLSNQNVSFPKHAPFRYYDTSYKARYLKGYKSLKDILSGYKDYKLNEIYLKGLADNYPELISYHEIGKTHGGRPIPAIKITSDNLVEEKANVLFNCSHHSNEVISVEHCYDIIYNLLKKPQNYARFLEHLNIWFIPIVNPDGSYLFWYKSRAMGRKNGFLFDDQSPEDLNRGVDLNRNYPFKWNSGHPTASSGNRNHPFFRGTAPASEPETKAMISLFETERFLLSMSFHTYAAKVLYPYSIENLNNPKPDLAKEMAHRIIKNSKSYHPTKKFEAVKNIYAVDGTDQDFFYFKYGTLAFLTESSHRNIPYQNVSTVMDGYSPIWENLLDEYVKGYKLILKIVNQEDEPVSCNIEVEEFLYYEGEKYTNNPKTGYYHKLFPDDTEYTLKATCPGYETELLKFNPNRKFYVTEIVLKKK